MYWPPITTVVTLAKVVSPGARYDLISLADVKLEMGIPSTDTSQDAWLLQAIKQCSVAVARYCNRVFQAETVQDMWYESRAWADRRTSIQLSRWPVISAVSVVVDEGLDTETTLVAGTDYVIRGDVGEIEHLTDGMPSHWGGAKTLTVVYTAGYDAEADQEAHTIPATPYQITAAQAATFIADRGVTYANGIALAKVPSSPTSGQYAVSSAGLYTFAAADTTAGILLDYLYSEVPANVQDATLRLVTGRLKARGRDPLLKELDQPGVGREVYWIGGPPMSGNLPAEIAAILDGYRVPVV